jgi:hypothetical protein
MRLLLSSSGAARGLSAPPILAQWRKPALLTSMEVLTPKATRRSTRLRVEIPVTVTSLDRHRPFSEECLVLVVSAQGCGFRSPRPLQIETPIMLSGLAENGSVTARVANCLPLGSDGKYFLIGASLYTHGNVWGIENPPDDWNAVPKSANSCKHAPKANGRKAAWPYNLASVSTPNPKKK